MTAPTSLAALFRGRAQAADDRTAYVIVADDGAETRITWSDLADAARRVAAVYRREAVRPRGRVLIVLDHGPALVEALWAGIAAGFSVGCYRYPNRSRPSSGFAAGIAALTHEVAIDLVVTEDWLAPALIEAVGPGGPPVLGRTALTDAELAPIEDLPMPEPGDEQAFLFSGGTTGRSKVSPQSVHAVGSQLTMLAGTFDAEPGENHVHWVPLSHDLGFVVGFLLPAWVGATGVLASAFSWARSPGRFLRLVDEWDARVTAMPNFGLVHTTRCVREADRSRIDLSRLRYLFCAAEPVRPAALRAFTDRFAPSGFRPDAFRVGYGMAEATCGLTATRPGMPSIDRVLRAGLHEHGRAESADLGPADDGITEITSCGVPLAGVRVEIVDQAGRVLSPRQIGHIVAKSPSLMTGYLPPSVPSPFLPDGWYRTGDIGYRAGGELYVIGRGDDVVIASGRNIAPEQVEQLVGEVSGVRPSGVVAFGIDDSRRGTQGLVVVAELERGVDADQRLAVDREVRLRIETAFDVAVADVRLTSHGWIERGSSGKIARAACRTKYLGESPPRTCEET